MYFKTEVVLFVIIASLQVLTLAQPAKMLFVPIMKRSADDSIEEQSPPCQDGSGGICVNVGECPPHLQANTNSTLACEPGKECCFGPSSKSQTCRSRGGECVTKEVCGKAPVFREATDCPADQVCCIFV